MRKTQKSQAEDTIDLMDRALGEIRKALERKETELVLDLLGQCQDAAIAVGNMIENEEGEGTSAVHLLEEYCEQLYQIYEAVTQSRSVNAQGSCKTLRKKLVQVRNSIRNDIKTRTEAVFLPYKASMWDSLESVWRAADEDENCDAYVVPIPYYDRNPDGSFGQMHYEGDLYPEDVPVVKYEDYDFAGRRPDMIFIHNPYDECNYVTSVHPFFYSSNLKQFTDKLIYIPYFVLGEIDPENRQAVEGMAHFCTCPGVVNADRVIVQSENMRKVYINVLTEAMGADTRKIWEEKILGLGSPKFDKAQGTKREDIDIPEEWLGIIRKPDGSRKKIILYNTSVNALLHYDEKMLEKIKSVLEIFRQEKDEVALLWRPHPLIEATIASMRPQLWEGYREIVAKYRQEGWGIYDDTADLNRAVALADAYYGDGSSVVQLCQSVGMPVMIQTP